MTYEKICELNPQLKIYKTSDKEFIPFGKVISDICPNEFIKAAEFVAMPEVGSSYVPTLEAFENVNAINDIKVKYFGEMPIQAGYCWGYSDHLNAVEWHKSSEVNVAVTPLILFLGQVQDIVDNKIDSSKMKAFYVEKGEVLEVYATTLHFCPCQVEKSGFKCVVVLPQGTNVPLDGEYEDKIMFRKNKWILCHVDNEALIARGVVRGVTGINFEVKGE